MPELSMETFLEQFTPDFLLPKLQDYFGASRDNPKKILHIATGNLFGGIEKTLLALHKFGNLAPNLHQTFALLFQGKLSGEFDRDKVGYVDLGPARLRYPWQVLRCRRALANFLRRDSQDLVVVHSTWTHAIFAPVIKASGAKLVLWLHDAVEGKSPNRTWQEFFSGFTRPDILLANSRYTAQTASGLFPGMDPLISYPITEIQKKDRIHCRLEMRKRLECPDTRKVILIASRFEPYKGHRQLVEKLGELPKSVDWECWIAGSVQSIRDQVLVDQLKERAEELGIGHRLRWIGFFDDILPVFAAADVFCQPNQGPEPFGQVFLEAQALGCPVLTYNMGGASEAVFPGWPNHLIPRGDKQAMVAALKGLVAGGGSKSQA